MELPQKLPSRAKNCFSTKAPFEPGQKYVSQMVYSNDQWERRDFTPEAWVHVKEKGEFWHGSIPLKEEKKQDRSPLALFERRHALDPLSPVVFLLALYLERQKVLLYRPSLAKLPSRCYEEPINGTLYCVTPVALTKEEESRVIEELKEVIDHASGPGI